jgi:hypothetical protein
MDTSKTNTEVLTMIQQKDSMKREISQMENKINVLKDNIKEIDKQLFNKCKHIWEYDRGCAFDDHTKYFCSTCSVWKNAYWYE